MTTKPNPVLLPNVVFCTKLQEKGVPKEAMQPTYDFDGMRELLWELASKNPLWDFEISRFSMYKLDGLTTDGTTHNLYVKEITVKENRETLGSFAVDYHGNTRKIFITNERIAKERTRRNNGRMATGDIKRAYREITKNFYLKNPRERTAEAVQIISQKLGEIDRKISHSVFTAEHEFQSAASAFVKSHPEVLTSFQQPDASKDKALVALASWDTHSEAKSKVSEVEWVTNAVWSSLAEPGKHKAPSNAAVVISQGSSYVLTYKGETCTIPSEDLPEELRAPLGMLKLSDAMQVVEGIGFRVDNRIFLVFAGEQ